MAAPVAPAPIALGPHFVPVTHYVSPTEAPAQPPPIAVKAPAAAPIVTAPAAPAIVHMAAPIAPPPPPAAVVSHAVLAPPPPPAKIQAHHMTISAGHQGARDTFFAMYGAHAQALAQARAHVSAGRDHFAAQQPYVAPIGYTLDGQPRYGLSDEYDSILYGLGDLT